MKKIVIGVCCFIFFIGLSYSQSIHSVRVGYEAPIEGPFPTAVVFRGDTVIISWQSTGISGTIDFEIRKTNNSYSGIIINNYPYNDLPKSYKIPSHLTSGKYVIRIKQGALFSDSNVFTIKAPRSIGWVNVFLEGKPTPPSGFTIGQTLAISWDNSNISGNGNIVLKKATTPFTTLTVSNNRPLSDIPATILLNNSIVPGTYYAEVRQNTLSKKSSNFIIKPKLVFIPLPDLAFFNIKWKYYSIPQKFNPNFLILEGKVINKNKIILLNRIKYAIDLILFDSNSKKIYVKTIYKSGSNSLFKFKILNSAIKHKIKNPNNLSFKLILDKNRKVKESNKKNNIYGPKKLQKRFKVLKIK